MPCPRASAIANATSASPSPQRTTHRDSHPLHSPRHGPAGSNGTANQQCGQCGRVPGPFRGSGPRPPPPATQLLGRPLPAQGPGATDIVSAAPASQVKRADVVTEVPPCSQARPWSAVESPAALSSPPQPPLTGAAELLAAAQRAKDVGELRQVMLRAQQQECLTVAHSLALLSRLAALKVRARLICSCSVKACVYHEPGA